MLEVRTYALRVERDEAGGYRAVFPALPGCGAWGAVYEEAVGRAAEALIGYLSALERVGEKPPKDRTRQPFSLGVTVRTAVIA